MVSRVFMICDAYESGIGHGLQRDGLEDGASYYPDPELAEAYNLGYDLGEERAKGGGVKPPIFRHYDALSQSIAEVSAENKPFGGDIATAFQTKATK